MPPLYPLRFTPIFRRYVWGGRKLAHCSTNRSATGTITPKAGNWSIAATIKAASPMDHWPAQRSANCAKPTARNCSAAIIPSHGFRYYSNFSIAKKRFRCKCIPTTQQAARLNPPDFGKTEAWVVLAAEPGSIIYAGLKRGFDRHAFEREVHRGTCELCLHRIEPQPGDCIFLPAGAVHALGAGMVIAEIQQASDATFRLFDWNRLGSDGKPRPLHVQQASDVIDYDLGPIHLAKPKPTDAPQVERLVECDKFVVDRSTLDTPQSIGGDERFHFLAMIEGEIEIKSSSGQASLRFGQTLLIPASAGHVRSFRSVEQRFWISIFRNRSKVAEFENLERPASIAV